MIFHDLIYLFNYIPTSKYSHDYEIHVTHCMHLTHYHHHQINVHFLPRSIKGMDGCFPTASGSVDKQPLATFWGLSFSHTDASVSRKSRLVTILKSSVYIPGNVGASFAGFPHTNQLGLGKRRWNLETSSAVVEFPPP